MFIYILRKINIFTHFICCPVENMEILFSVLNFFLLYGTRCTNRLLSSADVDKYIV